MKKLLPLLLILFFTALSVMIACDANATPRPQETDLTDIQERGRAATEWFYSEEFDKLLELGLTEAMGQAIETGGGFEAIHGQLVPAVGAELEVLEEQVVEAQGMQVYVRTARFENVERAVVQWAFDSELKIGGFFIRPAQ